MQTIQDSTPFTLVDKLSPTGRELVASYFRIRSEVSSVDYHGDFLALVAQELFTSLSIEEKKAIRVIGVQGKDSVIIGNLTDVAARVIEEANKTGNQNPFEIWWKKAKEDSYYSVEIRSPQEQEFEKYEGFDRITLLQVYKINVVGYDQCYVELYYDTKTISQQDVDSLIPTIRSFLDAIGAFDAKPLTVESEFRLTSLPEVEEKSKFLEATLRQIKNRILGCLPIEITHETNSNKEFIVTFMLYNNKPSEPFFHYFFTEDQIEVLRKKKNQNRSYFEILSSYKYSSYTGFAGTVLRTRFPIYCENFEEHPLVKDMEYDETVLSVEKEILPGRGLYEVPLIWQNGDKFLGLVMVIFDANKFSFSDMDKKLVTEIVYDSGYSVYLATKIQSFIQTTQLWIEINKFVERSAPHALMEQIGEEKHKLNTLTKEFKDILLKHSNVIERMPKSDEEAMEWLLYIIKGIRLKSLDTNAR